MRRVKWCSAVFVLVLFSLLPLYGQEVYFSLKGGCAERIIQEIEEAQNKIDVAMYILSYKSIADALIRAFERGVEVRVLLDSSEAAKWYSKDEYLKKKGVSVLLGPGLMHNKFCWKLNGGVTAKPSTWRKIGKSISVSIGASLPGPSDDYWTSGVILELRPAQLLKPWLFFTQSMSFSRFEFDREAFRDELPEEIGWIQNPYLIRELFSEWERTGKDPNMDLFSLTLGLSVLLPLKDTGLFFPSESTKISFLGGVGGYRLKQEGIAVTYEKRSLQLLEPRSEGGFGGYVGLRLYSKDFFGEVVHHSIAFSGRMMQVVYVKIGMDFEL